MTEPRTSRAAAPSLRRSVGLGLLTFYGVGVMVGAGIYVLIGEVASHAGEWTPLAFILAGAVAALTAASFAELAGRIPVAGGEVAYSRAAFGSATLSLAVGGAVVMVGVLSAAAVLQGGVSYLQAFAPASTEVLVLLIGAALTMVAIIGVVESLAFAATLTAIELVGLGLIVAVAFAADPATTDAAKVAAPPALDASKSGAAGLGGLGLAGIASAVFLAFFAFIGFEDMVNMAEETREPARAVPRAILLAFLLVTAIYVTVAFAALRVASPEELATSPRPLATVYENATGQAPVFIAIVGAMAALNGVLAQIVMAARVLYGLGEQNPRLAFLRRTHTRWRTPALATALAGSIVIGLALTAPLGGLASATSLVLIAVFVLMNVALIVLKRRGPPPPGAPNLPVWAPYLGAVASVAVVAGAAL